MSGDAKPLENHAPTETVKDNSSWLYWDFIGLIDSGIFFAPWGRSITPANIHSSSFCLLLHLYTGEDFGLSIDAEESIKSIKPCKILSISIQLHTAEDSLRTVAKESSL